MDLTNEVKKLVENAEYQEQNLSKIDYWSGAAGVGKQLLDHYSTTQLSAFQEFMAAKLASKVPGEKVTMDCIISDEAEFKRAYSIDGKVLEGDALEAMDTLFNAWLAQPGNEMIMQDGIIYSGTDQGEVAKDNSSNAVKERADKVRQLLSDPVKGFESYVQDKKQGAKIEIIRHEEAREEPVPSH